MADYDSAPRDPGTEDGDILRERDEEPIPAAEDRNQCEEEVS